MLEARFPCDLSLPAGRPRRLARSCHHSELHAGHSLAGRRHVTRVFPGRRLEHDMAVAWRDLPLEVSVAPGCRQGLGRRQREDWEPASPGGGARSRAARDPRHNLVRAPPPVRPPRHVAMDMPHGLGSQLRLVQQAGRCYHLGA